MSSRLSAALVVSALWLAGGLALIPTAEGQEKPKELTWTHAFDLSCRRFGELDFSKQTQKLGVEAFRDANNDLGVYLSQAGTLAVGRGFQDLKLPLQSKGPEWVTGLDLPARSAGEEKFESAKVHSLEVFRDPNTNNWIYITEKGFVAVAASAGKTVASADKRPKWTHSVDLRVRKGGVKDWKDASKFGIEVYRDNSTGNLIYICETGSIAVITDSGNRAADAKAPSWLHGLDLLCRKSNEPSFTKDTRKFGVEVFLDANNGNLIFITETGNLAVTPGSASIQAPTPKIKEPTWTHGLNLKARKAGEREFSERTAVFGAEAFRDENVGVTLYIGETGAIAAVGK